MLFQLCCCGVVAVGVEGAHLAHEVRVSNVRGQGFAVKTAHATDLAARVRCHVLLVSLVIEMVQLTRKEMAALTQQTPHVSEEPHQQLLTEA